MPAQDVLQNIQRTPRRTGSLVSFPMVRGGGGGGMVFMGMLLPAHEFWLV